MTNLDDIVFYCKLCGQKIAVGNGRAGGFDVDCPSCRGRITVPRRGSPECLSAGPAAAGATPLDAGKEADRSQLPGRPATKRIVIAKKTSPGTAPTQPMGPAAGGLPTDDIWMPVLGPVCLVLAVVIARLAPHAVFVHAALFLTALVVAFLCISRRLALYGAVLLFATVSAVQVLEVPLVTPLLEQLVPKPATVQVQMPPPAETAPAAAPEREPADLACARPPAPPPRRAPGRPQPPAEPVEVFEPAPPAAEPPARKEADIRVEETAPRHDEPPPPRAPEPAPNVSPIKAVLPFRIYADCPFDMPYYASGWMGYHEALELDECWEENPHSAPTCIRMAYNATYHWGGVAWQTPPNNWGDQPGGFDLTGARELSFWARAESDNTVAEFKVGLRGNGPYADTVSVTSGKRKLSKRWKRFDLSLKGNDLSRVISGFVCVVEGNETPAIIYLDDIEYR